MAGHTFIHLLCQKLRLRKVSDETLPLWFRTFFLYSAIQIRKAFADQKKYFIMMNFFYFRVTNFPAKHSNQSYMIELTFNEWITQKRSFFYCEKFPNLSLNM